MKSWRRVTSHILWKPCWQQWQIFEVSVWSDWMTRAFHPKKHRPVSTGSFCPNVHCCHCTQWFWRKTRTNGCHTQMLRENASSYNRTRKTLRSLGTLATVDRVWCAFPRTICLEQAICRGRTQINSGPGWKDMWREAWSCFFLSGVCVQKWLYDWHPTRFH